MLSVMFAGARYLRNRFPGFAREEGAVATEYGLLLVLIALAIVAAALALGIAISDVFERGDEELGRLPASGGTT